MNTSQLKIEQKLSESTTTSVYRAFDEVLHRRVLLKVLHKHLANDTDVRSRFIREARACAALRSEHIVQIFDLTALDEAPAIVMEFVDGKSLKEVIAEGNNRNFEFAKKVAVHVLRGLSIAHDKGIIHRDIKPGNILVANDGIIKVTDFGLASFVMAPTVTMDGMVVGTPAYMAPEQVRGEEIDARTDLFALGVTLIEILSGGRLFEGSTYSECMKKVLAFREPDLEKFSGDSSPEFILFLQRLMAIRRNERFLSAKDALSNLGEKKSSVFVRPFAVNTSRKKMLPYFIMTCVAFMVIYFGWTKLSHRTSSNQQSVDTLQSISLPPFDSIKAFTHAGGGRGEPTANNTIRQMPNKDTEPMKGKNVADSGSIVLVSSPWAKIFIDNKLIGETPLAKPIVLAVGSHAVMFTNPSFDPIVKTVMVGENKEMTVTGDFFSQAGFVMCMVSPWAEVYIDEQYKDTTPLSKPIILSAGKHTLRLKNASFTDIVKEITVQPHDTLNLSISFSQ